MKTIRIGAGQGFWGNGPYGAQNMVEKGDIDYLCCDALAELTLAILKKGMKKNAYAGWVNELTPIMEHILPTLKEKKIRFISNHGGLNPMGAVDEIKRIADKMGITGLKIAAVTGDSVYDRVDEFIERKIDLSNMDTGESIETIRDRIVFANAYIGAKPIVEALEQGADIVITGRAADSALFLAPMIYSFGWSWEDWDKLAVGTLAGHLLECSAQSTGGNFGGDWWNVPDMENIGYPIAEVKENGELIITKPEGTGGRVSIPTVTEQMVYETLDPNNYICPDVIADFTSPTLTDLGDDRVLITGMKGKPRPEKLKVYMCYNDGWAASNALIYSWPYALKKAYKVRDIVQHELDQLGVPYDTFRCDLIGVNSIHGPAAPIPDDDSINEIAVKLTLKTYDRDAAKMFPKLIPAWALDGPPAVSVGGGFSTSPRGLLGPWSTLVDRNEIEPSIQISYVNI